MKKVALIAVSIFEILCGLGGFTKVLGWLAGVTPYDPVPALWFGFFPILSLMAGVMLLLRTKYCYDLSRIILILQIPFIVVSGSSLLRVAVAFNFYLTAYWLGRNGSGPTILGFNVLAIGMFILLIWSKGAIESVEEPSDIEIPPPPSDLFPE